MAQPATERDVGTEGRSATVFERLLRLGGLAALCGGALLLLTDLLVLAEGHKDHSGPMTSAEYTLHAVLALGAGGLVLVGLVGLYAAQARRAGLFGAAAFAAALLATALAFAVAWDAAFAVPSMVHAGAGADVLRPEALPGPYAFGITLTFWSMAAGWALFAASMLWAGVFPRGAAAFLAVGALFFLCPVPPTAFIGVVVGQVELLCSLPISHLLVSAGTVLWDMALAWIGFVLLTRISLKPNLIHPTP